MLNKYHNKRVWILIFTAVFAITLVTGTTFARAEKSVLLDDSQGLDYELLLAKAGDNNGNAFGLDEEEEKDFKDNNGNAYGHDKQAEEEVLEEEELPASGDVLEEEAEEEEEEEKDNNGNAYGQDKQDEPDEEDSGDVAEEEEKDNNGNAYGQDKQDDEDEPDEEDSGEESEDESNGNSGGNDNNGKGNGNFNEDETSEEEVSEDGESSGNGNGNNDNNGNGNDTDNGNGGENGNGNEEDSVDEEISSDSSLIMIYIGDKKLPGFKADKMEYTYQLPKDTTSLPKILAVPTDENASVHYEKLTFLPDQMTITVTAEDGESKTHYKLNLGVKGLAPGEIIYLEEVPLPVLTEILGLWLPPTEDDFILEKKCTKIRFWVSQELMYPQIWIFEAEEVTQVIENEGSEEETSSTIFGEYCEIIGTSELKSSSGHGKHSNSSVENGEGGYYKYNLKGKNFPDLEVGKNYVLAVMNEGSVVMFGQGNPAILHFTVGEFVKSGVNERNKTLNETVRRSNVSSNR
jgi:hypothetical protein